MMAELLSKDLVRDLFRLKELPRPPFIPWISSFAAQLEQISVQEMLSDPGLLSTALLNAQELFGYDAIAVGLDSSLEAEALGCQIDWPGSDDSLPSIVSHPLSEGMSLQDLEKPDFLQKGRIPVFLEAFKRISILRSKQLALMGVVTGPFTLARHLTGDSFLSNPESLADVDKQAITAAGSVCLKLCRKYCEAGVDVVVVSDEVMGQLPLRLYPLAAPALKSVWNVVNFFGRPSLLLTTGCHNDSISPALDLGAAGISLGSRVDASPLAGIASPRKACFGISIDISPAATLPELVLPVKGYFLTTDGEVPCATPIETMHKVMELVSLAGNS
jgi:uroporphyrinogen-III decarboxylase